jgi:putative tryptophan/tyrosine transport system substrate-binding protein
MKRRNFITLLACAAAAWPFAARAQQPVVPVIGFLYSGAPETSVPWVAAFRKGLSETGFSEGHNVAIEYRWAHNEPERLPELAADLVRRGVAVIVTPGITAATLAAKAATTTIPIVFRTGADPVEVGLVTGLNRPGGNVTGVAAMTLETESKRLGLLHELLPGAARFAVLINPSDPRAEPLTKDLQAAASTIRREVDFFGASIVQKRPDALLVSPQGLFSNRRVQIVTQATRHALPAIYYLRDFVEIGGLMSYGSSPMDQFRLTGIYAGRVLKGEKPADMPILRATKFELIINLQTAKVIGIDVPATLLARADEVIE